MSQGLTHYTTCVLVRVALWVLFSLLLEFGYVVLLLS